MNLTVKVEAPTPRTIYEPRLGYRGFLCSRCGAKAERDRRLPSAFVCFRPSCESQVGEWVDEVQ